MKYLSICLIVILHCFQIILNDDTVDPCDKRFTIITDFNKGDCGEDYYYIHEYNDCFPGCLPKPDPRADCVDGECPQGFYCPPHTPPDTDTCKINEDSCAKYYTDFSDNPYYNNVKFPPKCTDNGEWAAKQCKGDPANGRCFCYDSKGKRLFGQEFSHKAKDMTCACSRRRDELEKLGIRSYLTLHCDSMGNYEPLQCDSDLCWCAEPKTGKLTSTVVPSKAMTLLPCYDKKNVGDMYLRQCESQKYGQAKVAEKLKVHGTMSANFQPLFCDGDGSYGSYKIQGNQLYCTWRDNTFIGSYQATIENDLSTYNCNCARDRKFYELQGIPITSQCFDNGNYVPLQSVFGKYFCVDDDGFPITDEMTAEPSKDYCDSVLH